MDVAEESGASKLEPSKWYISAEDVPSRKPAGKLMEESIRDSYYPVKRQLDRSRSAVEMGDFNSRRRRRATDGAYFELLDRESYSLRPRRVTRARESSPLRTALVDCAPGRSARAWAAPAVAESTPHEHSLPARRCYSRYTQGDPDYFDFDLDHSVDMYRKWRDYVPRFSPQFWEHKLIRDLAHSQGSKHIAPYLFIRGEKDWRYSNSSFLSCALRTETYWAHRFRNL